jgi:hypothetical protein
VAARVAWQPQPERLKTGAQACRVLRLRGLVAGQTEDHPKATCQGMKQPTLPRVTPGPTSCDDRLLGVTSCDLSVGLG